MTEVPAQQERVLAVWAPGPLADATLRAACLRARYRGGRVAVLMSEHGGYESPAARGDVVARARGWAGDETPVDLIAIRGSLLIGAVGQTAQGPTSVVVISANRASEAQAIVHQTRVPVLVVRSQGGGAHVVAGTDLRDPALPIVRAAATEARRAACSLSLVHALEPPARALDVGGRGLALSDDWIRERRSTVERELGRALELADVDASADAIEGLPAQVLDEAARRLDAQMIVVGTRPRRAGVAIGGTAAALLRHGRCCVLVIPLG